MGFKADNYNELRNCMLPKGFKGRVGRPSQYGFLGICLFHSQDVQIMGTYQKDQKATKYRLILRYPLWPSIAAQAAARGRGGGGGGVSEGVQLCRCAT